MSILFSSCSYTSCIHLILMSHPALHLHCWRVVLMRSMGNAGDKTIGLGIWIIHFVGTRTRSTGQLGVVPSRTPTSPVTTMLTHGRNKWRKISMNRSRKGEWIMDISPESHERRSAKFDGRRHWGRSLDGTMTTSWIVDWRRRLWTFGIRQLSRIGSGGCRWTLPG